MCKKKFDQQKSVDDYTIKKQPDTVMVLRKRITPKFNHDLVDVETSGINLKSKLPKADKTCMQWSIQKPNSLFDALSTQEGSQ